MGPSVVRLLRVALGCLRATRPLTRKRRGRSSSKTTSISCPPSALHPAALSPLTGTGATNFTPDFRLSPDHPRKGEGSRAQSTRTGRHSRGAPRLLRGSPSASLPKPLPRSMGFHCRHTRQSGGKSERRGARKRERRKGCSLSVWITSPPLFVPSLPKGTCDIRRTTVGAANEGEEEEG